MRVIKDSNCTNEYQWHNVRLFYMQSIDSKISPLKLELYTVQFVIIPRNSSTCFSTLLFSKEIQFKITYLTFHFLLKMGTFKKMYFTGVLLSIRLFFSSPHQLLLLTIKLWSINYLPLKIANLFSNSWNIIALLWLLMFKFKMISKKNVGKMNCLSSFSAVLESCALPFWSWYTAV